MVQKSATKAACVIGHVQSTAWRSVQWRMKSWSWHAAGMMAFYVSNPNATAQAAVMTKPSSSNSKELGLMCKASSKRLLVHTVHR